MRVRRKQSSACAGRSVPKLGLPTPHVSMLPVVAGAAATRRQILLYSLVLAPVGAPVFPPVNYGVAVAGEELEGLHRSGVLRAAYAVLSSLANVSRLIDAKLRKQACDFGYIESCVKPKPS